MYIYIYIYVTHFVKHISNVIFDSFVTIWLMIPTHVISDIYKHKGLNL